MSVMVDHTRRANNAITTLHAVRTNVRKTRLAKRVSFRASKCLGDERSLIRPLYWPGSDKFPIGLHRAATLAIFYGDNHVETVNLLLEQFTYLCLYEGTSSWLHGP